MLRTAKIGTDWFVVDERRYFCHPTFEIQLSSNPSIAATIGHWIDGRQMETSGRSTFSTCDPDQGCCLAEVVRGCESDVDRAARSAAKAQREFENLGPSARESILLRAAELLRRDRQEFVDLLVREIGSPLNKARMELAIAERVLQANASMARRMTGRTYRSDVPGRLSFAERKPLGVVAGMTPFNVPLIKGVKHSSMPLATGNAFVLLPSPHAPLVANRLAELYREAGLPAGVFNVVYGAGEVIGPALIRHPVIRAVSFTGSASVGRQVHAACGQFQKKVTLELGGKNPLIVFDDADVDQALTAAVRGGFFYQGQICMASSRVIVTAGIAENFIGRFVDAARALPVGDLQDPATVIGPIIDDTAKQRICSYLEDAIAKGAHVLCGNQWSGNRLNPTVLSGVTDKMRLYCEEVFAPVVTVEIARDQQHAIDLAHACGRDDHPAILSAAVFTRDLDRAISMSRSLQCGMVHVNEMTIQQEPEVPFGSDGDAGFGREGMETGIDDYSTWKWITIQGPTSIE